MTAKKGLAQTPRNSRIKRQRPALDARLGLIVSILGELDGVAATIAIDQIVRAGLEREGYATFADRALNTEIKTDEDFEKLKKSLRRALQRKKRMQDQEGIQMAL